VNADTGGDSELEYRPPWSWPAIGSFVALSVFFATDTRDWQARVAILCAGFVVAAWLRQVRVEARADLLLVRNFARTARVPWEQVRTVQAVTDPAFGPTAVVRLRNGGQIRIAALTAARGGDGAFIPERVAQLNRYHRSHRTTRPAGAVSLKRVRGDGYWAQWMAQIGLGFLIAGLLAGTGGIYLIHEANRFADHGQPARAVVTNLEWSSKYPTVTVTYQVDGTTYAEPAVEWLGTPQIGDSIDVVYDKTDPSRVTDAAVAGNGGAFLEAFFVLGLGLVSAAGALVLLIKARG
jgi:hypothetical protein